jgi:hypothetical protein
LFGAGFEVLLYDLTSTYFESSQPDDEDDKRRFGHSRDKRNDCVQVVIALIVTPDGFPLAYEVLPGNTADCTTLRDALRKIETQYGKADRIWIMHRGIPSEEVLAEMRKADLPVSYLVGTPKGRLSKLEKALLKLPWQAVREGIDVKLLRQEQELSGSPDNSCSLQSGFMLSGSRAGAICVKKIWILLQIINVAPAPTGWRNHHVAKDDYFIRACRALGRRSSQARCSAHRLPLFSSGKRGGINGTLQSGRSPFSVLDRAAGPCDIGDRRRCCSAFREAQMPLSGLFLPRAEPADVQQQGQAFCSLPGGSRRSRHPG